MSENKPKSTSWYHVVNWSLTIVIGGCCIILARKLIENTRPRSQEEMTAAIRQCLKERVPSESRNSVRTYRITQEEMDNAMRAVAYAAHQEIKQDYDDRFSILITLLTIFGIAWPLVVAFVQHKFNERDLDKIEEAIKTAKAASETANSASETANSASKTAEGASYIAEKARIEQLAFKVTKGKIKLEDGHRTDDI